MGEVIFKEITLRKTQFYPWLKNLFKEAGWEDISSRPADGEVFFSRGEDELSELYINIKEYSSSASSSLSESIHNDLYHRPLDSYKPSANKGSAGTFYPASGTFSETEIGNGTDCLLRVHYYADKDRVTFFVSPPISVGYYHVFLFFGKPLYDGVGDITKKAIVCGTPMYRTNVCRVAYNDMETITDHQELIEKKFEMPNGLSTEGKLFVSDIVFSDNGSVYGNLLKIPGVLSIGESSRVMSRSNESFNDNEFFIGEKKYKTIYLKSGSYYFGSSAMAFRVE